MTTRKSLLGQLSIPSPCSADWNGLVGDDRTRYCEQCDKHVYDFSKMTATEAVALLVTLRGRVCARITWQPDGTVLTEEPLPVFPVVRRRASPLASVAVTTLITITASPAGLLPAQAAGIVQTNLDSAKRNPEQMPQPGDTTASIAGTVLDQNGAVIAGAKVSLITEAGGETRVVTSSDAGEYRFSGLDEGAFTVRVESPGFVTFNTQGVKVSSQQEQRLDVTMQVGHVSGGVIAVLPKPLRMLYNESDLVVVARIGASKTVESEREARLVKTALHVSSILKGNSRGSTVDLYHWNFGDLEGPFVGSEEVLLFLKRSKAERGHKAYRGYEIDDTQYGVKKLSGSELKAYVDRIAELSQITHENGPVDASVVEWLVRCAEDPATRWEGAYELLASVQRHSDSEAGQDTQVESTASTSQEDADAREDASATDTSDADQNDAAEDPNVGALLTVEQRTRLMTALFHTEELQNRDLQLMELARRWKEPRLVPFLIEQLRRLEANPSRFAERLMDCIAAALDEKEIANLAEQYQDNVSYPDEEVEREPGEATAKPANNTRDAETEAAIQTRSRMLGEFLRAVEVVLGERRAK